jgi:hypothetical protein
MVVRKNRRITGVCINDGVLHADDVVMGGAGRPPLDTGLSYDIGAPAGSVHQPGRNPAHADDSGTRKLPRGGL